MADKVRIRNARKPVGEEGREVIRRMNGGGHALLAEWGFSLLQDIPEDVVVLDAGCGGGANLARWLQRCPSGKVHGLDFSEISVEESIAYNAEAIATGRCIVTNGDVSNMPYADASFNYICAFETVYFWPDMPKTLKEVLRVLKPGGIFMICSESDGHDQGAVEASKMVEGLSLYDAERLQILLSEAGFSEIRIFKKEENHWLAAIAIRK